MIIMVNEIFFWVDLLPAMPQNTYNAHIRHTDASYDTGLSFAFFQHGFV